MTKASTLTKKHKSFQTQRLFPVSETLFPFTTILLLILATITGLSASPEGAFAQSKKIIFPAGPKDHIVPGRHEYKKDLRVHA